MDEDENQKEQENASSLKLKQHPCEVCKDNPAKYCCPRCSLRTCSLPCVKHHKSTTSCDGVRDKTAHVEMKNFTDTHLLSDYRFLEDAGRKVNSCYRDFLKRRHDRPKALMKLIRHAENLGIELKTMPYPMTKRKNNSTYLVYKTKEILWHIDWKFPQAEVTYTDKRQNHTNTLESVLKKYLHPTESDPLVRHRLRDYVKAGVEGCHLLMKAECRSAKNVRYHELDASKSIQDNLRGKCVVEYPTFHVVLASHCQDYYIMSPEEEDQMWRERRKKNFKMQGNSSSDKQDNQPKGDNSDLNLIEPSRPVDEVGERNSEVVCETSNQTTLPAQLMGDDCG